MKDIIKINKESDFIKEPYEGILSWSEQRFKKLGSRVFSYLALSPVSLIAPPIPYTDSFESIKINILLLTPSGGGKTKIAEALQEITYNPFPFESITPAKIQQELKGMENISLITGDASRILNDKVLLKVLEGILSEGRVSRMTMRDDERYSINAFSYMAGTPQDLNAYINGGILFRVAVIVVMHDKETQDEIGKDIINSIGVKKIKDLKIEQIANYYKWLKQCQLGLIPEHPPIEGYSFSDIQKEQVWKTWKEIRDKLKTNKYTNWYRELWGGFKYLSSLAIINRPNRKIINGIIYPNKDDLMKALFLMTQEIRTKEHILKCDKIAKKIKDIKYLEKVSDELQLKDYTKDMIEILMNK